MDFIQSDSDAQAFHAVRFYRDADGLSRLVASFVIEGLAEGQPALIIAAQEHRAAILDVLTQGLDVAALQESGTVALLDADEMLGRFMVGDLPDTALFERTVAPVIERLSGGGRRSVRAYGEMVDLLWQQGLPDAALYLEAQWNTLARTHRFSMLCGYASDNSFREGAVQDICRLHTHLLADADDASVLT